MKRFIPLLLIMGLGLQAHADINSVDRSKRAFRKDIATGVVYADLVVAYEPLPSFVSLGGKTVRQYLEEAFVQASLDLFMASKGAVQLGKVTVLPMTTLTNGTVKSDPDVVILADPTATTCPAGLLRPEERPAGTAPICADAHTGGYLGLAWWLPAQYLNGTSEQVFQKLQSAGRPASEGARAGISWNTLVSHGTKVLVHEFGHYLFAMRDEYEGAIFDSPEAFEAATEVSPTIANRGTALTGADATITPAAWNFPAGTAMGLLSAYSPATGFSIRSLPVLGTGSAEWPAFPGEIEEKYATTEQVATVATRGEVGATVRGGSMWSLETAIRTSLNEPYTPVVLPAESHNTRSEAKVEVYGAGQANIIVMDRSGSMLAQIGWSNPLELRRYDAAMDFFGRVTHTEAMGTGVAYPADSRFGVVSFEQEIKTHGTYPISRDDIKAFTIPYVPGTTNKRLAWMPSSNSIPEPVDRNRRTDLVSGLLKAQELMDGDLDRPFQRNVILISDGVHNFPDIDGFTGTEGLDGKYRVFAVSVDTKIDGTDQFGTKMQNLARQSVGPEGVKGLPFFTDGSDESGRLVQAANDIFAAINQMDVQQIQPSQLYRDAAREFSLTTDAGQTRAKMSVAWAGSVAPTLYLSLPNGQTFPEGNGNGIAFSSTANLKSFELDLTKYPAGTWKLRVTSPASLPITIYPSIAARSTRLQVNANVDPTYASATGRLPVTVTVQDGRPIEGAVVKATLVNRQTGVNRTMTLAWNGSNYSGAWSGNLQPGLSDLSISVEHPNNGTTFYAMGENRLPASLRSQYPYFQPRRISQQVWIAGAAPRKTAANLEAWTIQEEAAFAQGTRLKLFLKNGSSVPLTGLKARYFFSVSEFPNGVPAFSPTYLAGNSRVTVGTVEGRPGLAYVQYDFVGQTLQPNASTSNGQNGGEGGYIIDQQWRSPWNATNDWSAQGLKSTWTINPYVNIYDANGVLLVGNPDLDRPVLTPNSTPVVSLSSPDLIVAGASVAFVANAIDPDGDPMTYQWKVNGASVTGNGRNLVYTFATAGTYTVSVTVADNKQASTTVSTQVVVQATTGACTESNSRDLGAASSNLTLPLTAGANCFAIKADKMTREWNWTTVHFQANSDNGVNLSGLSVGKVPNGSMTSLSGFSQTVPFTDPGRGKNLYLKINANNNRTLRLNWWLN